MDTDGEGTTDGSVVEQDKPEGQPAGDDAQLGAGGQKALAAERTARKAAEHALAKMQAAQADAEKAKMSDLERAQTEVREATAAAVAAQATALRWRIAAETGTTSEDAELFLTASDEDGMRKQAARLQQMREATAGATPPGPRPDLKQGAGANGTPLNSSRLEDALRQKLGI